MKFGYYVHPKNKDDIRVYINGLYPYTKGRIIPKIWWEQSGDGVSICIGKQKNSVSLDIDQVRKDLLQKLVEEEYLDNSETFISWELAVRLCGISKEKQEDKPRKERVEGKKPPRQSPEANSERYVETYRLDMREVTLPQRQSIIVDHRTPEKLISLLKENPNIDVLIQEVDFGSIKIPFGENKEIVIERIDCSEIGGNVLFPKKGMPSENLLMLSEKLKLDLDVIPFYVMEGDIYENNLRASASNITSILSLFSVSQRMNVVSSYNIEHTAFLICSLAKQLQESSEYFSEIRSAKPELLLETKAYVLESIPAIDNKLASKLLQQFGTIANIAQATTEELMSLDGIGIKQAVSIYQAFH